MEKRHFLTDRERGVLLLMAAGHTAASAASRLYLSMETVKTHLHRVGLRFGTRNTLHSVVTAHRLGLLPFDASFEDASAHLSPQVSRPGWTPPKRVNGRLVHDDER